jgi:hypothetical protein
MDNINFVKSIGMTKVGKMWNGNSKFKDRKNVVKDEEPYIIFNYKVCFSDFGIFIILYHHIIMAWRNGLVINKLKMLYQCIDQVIKFYISSITFDSRKLVFKIIVIFTIFNFNHYLILTLPFLFMIMIA